MFYLNIIKEGNNLPDIVVGKPSPSAVKKTFLLDSFDEKTFVIVSMLFWHEEIGMHTEYPFDLREGIWFSLYRLGLDFHFYVRQADIPRNYIFFSGHSFIADGKHFRNRLNINSVWKGYDEEGKEFYYADKAGEVLGYDWIRDTPWVKWYCSSNGVRFDNPISTELVRYGVLGAIHHCYHIKKDCYFGGELITVLQIRGSRIVDDMPARIRGSNKLHFCVGYMSKVCLREHSKMFFAFVDCGEYLTKRADFGSIRCGGFYDGRKLHILNGKQTLYQLGELLHSDDK